MGSAYDVLVVGAGLYGCTIAREAVDRGLKPLVVDRRDHVGGNCYSKSIEGIDVHIYGPHVLHTDKADTWSYFLRFTDILPCVVTPIANFKGELYNLPFNMNTFHELWGVCTPEEARAKIEEQRVPCECPSNLEEHVLNMVGVDVYEKLVKGYTEKQYQKPCSELPASLISRMPLLYTFNNDYLHKRYQGVPEDGYDAMFNRMLQGVDVALGVDYLEDKERLDRQAPLVVYSGTVDSLFDYCYGPLEYRGRRFDHRVLDLENYQGVTLMNYTDNETPWLRTTEHKYFTNVQTRKTVVSFEYATPWKLGDEPFYSIGDRTNFERYECYKQLALREPNLVVGGRLGEYRYYTMADTVESALHTAERLFN